ncbi:hypothetical protein [Longispora albida]|uniref:hypothetical protein n=1 Tax=Longispora albida TaxID=203523 RepID=UPI00037912E1|nr:hypothetical protein [Longispora albida]
MAHHRFGDHPVIKALEDVGLHVTDIPASILGPGGNLLHGHTTATIYYGTMRIGYVSQNRDHEWDFHIGDPGDARIWVRPGGEGRAPQRRETPEPAATELFFAVCADWAHDIGMPGVDAVGIWYSPACQNRDEAQGYADGHEHPGAQVSSYVQS